MTTSLWLTIPTTNVEICKLKPSQEHLVSDWKPGQSYSGDPFPHVVYFNDCYYISDGHHRINYASKNGRKFIEVRLIYKINGQILVPLEMTG